MTALNQTHDPALRSFVETANLANAEFPIQNLPIGIYRRRGAEPTGGIAIGDRIFDLRTGIDEGLFTGDALTAAKAGSETTLNNLMGLGNAYMSALRAQLSGLLQEGSAQRAKIESLGDRILVPMAEAELLLPAKVDAFTDMMVSYYHTSSGRQGQPGRTAPKNFKHLPIGYNSRASSVVISGTPFHRPHGIYQDSHEQVVFGPEPRQDFEFELGGFVAKGNAFGQPVPIGKAADHIFGLCLLNDWSSRAIQVFEMPPLGPFLGKSCATTISPWIVTAEALAPFRIPATARAEGDPPALPHLTDAEDQRAGGFDIDMEILLSSEKMRREGQAPSNIGRTNFKFMYWTFAQMLTHHTSNGCNLRPGDLIGSGTVSGPDDENCGCLAEKTASNKVPFTLDNGETRLFLQDQDEVIFRAWARRPGYVPISFGEARGRVLPAIPWPA